MRSDLEEEINELRPLARGEEVEEASRRALDRVAVGEGYTLNAEEFTWNESRGDDATPCFGRIRSGVHAGDLCMRMAGAGTDHPGFGPCNLHGGNKDEGRREAAWVVAHKFATALDVTPWEGLLWAVKIAAGKVAYAEQKLGEARSDTQFMPPEVQERTEARREAHAITSGDAMRWKPGEGESDGENLNWWVKQSEFWHDRLTKVSKLAIDAGVAERLVRQIELEATLMLRATNLTLDELGLTGEVRERALAAMSRNLLALEAEEVSGTPDIVGT